jgi:serine/threonine protein kinase
MEDFSKPKSHGILNEKYQLLDLLGEGSTSRVYLGVRLEDNSFFAIKLFKAEFINYYGDLAK